MSAARPLEIRFKIVVLGIGNPIRSDDGVGVYALHRLAEDPRVCQATAGIAFIDAGTRGIDLVNDTADASHVLVLDAVDVGAAPGTLVSVSGPELSRLPGGWTVHQLGVVDWMRTLLLLTGRLPEIRVLGLQPAETTWGTALSSSIAPAMDRLVDAAIDQLQQWVQANDGEPVA